MSIMRRNNLFPVMNTLFDDFFTRDLWNNNSSSATNTSIPAVNIRETNDQYLVEVAAPGMSKEDFKVELDGNLLTISSEKNETSEQKEGERYTRREFSYQSFERSFQLHKDVVDADRIEAKYENGVLHLIIPKKEEVKQKTRTIQIS
jgi:HSP20 family protein